MEILSDRPYISQLPDPGVLYRHLRKLERAGLVTSTLEPGGGPARRVYTITQDGTACLGDWVKGLEQLKDQLSDLITDTKAL
jgi:PadR family transcriptional regulator